MYTNKDILPAQTSQVVSNAVDVLRLSEIYELDKCVQWINESHANRICLQFSQDQLANATHIARLLEEKLNKKVYILGDTSYGTCCIDEVTAEHVQADAVIHFGHSCLSPSDRIPVLHIFNKNLLHCSDLIECLKKVLSFDDHILLLYDVSYYHVKESLNCLLEDFKKLIVSDLTVKNSSELSTLNIFGRSINLPENADIHNYTIVFVGEDGPTSVNFKYLFPSQPFYIFNPSSCLLESYEINMSRFLRRRMYLIECLKNIKTLGILIGTLCVKSYLQLVDRVKRLAKSKGIRCYIISVGRVNVAKLANFPEIDAFVLISCAENSLLDSKEFLQPVVTPYEVELAYNKAYKWSERYVTDFTTLLPGNVNYVQEDETCTQDEMNVSLVSGQLSRPSTEGHLVQEKSDAVLSRGINALSDTETHSVNFLTSRSWSGLEPKLGETSVQKATQGRSGIPYKYDNESI